MANDHAWNTAVRTTLAAASAVALLWFLHEVLFALLLCFFAIVLSVVVNAPVTWLERRGVHRAVGTILVFLGCFAVILLVGWLVLPRVFVQSRELVTSLPDYVSRLRDLASSALGDSSAMGRSVRDQLPRNVEEAVQALPPVTEILGLVGRYSFSVFGAVALLIILLAIVGYLVVEPRSMLELYLRAFPERLRDQAARAFSRASEMWVSWMWSNVVAGRSKRASWRSCLRCWASRVSWSGPRSRSSPNSCPRSASI